MQPTPDIPNVRDLYLPLLACLPTAFISPRPPPNFLPLLSPILRQRVHLNTSVQPLDPQQIHNPAQDSAWLKLLTWSPTRAAKLNEVVSSLQLEPHPVSGEIELFGNDDNGTEGRPLFRRWDPEVLQASIVDHEHNLAVIWVWCTNDTGGAGLENAATKQSAHGWRVSELFSADDWPSEQKPEWHSSIADAEAAAATQAFSRPAAPARRESTATNGHSETDEGNEDDYWAMYDRTPGAPTPAAKYSPAPLSTTNGRDVSAAQEDAYFSRYADVQPAMDAHDPVEEKNASQIETTLRGEALLPPLTERRGRELVNENGGGTDTEPFSLPLHPTGTKVVQPHEGSRANGQDRIHSPKPSRPSSSRADSPQSNAVANLEARARSMSNSSAVELGIKQHISTEIKSLFRLCRGVGIEREEFQRIVEREFEVLSLMDDDT